MNTTLFSVARQCMVCIAVFFAVAVAVCFAQDWEVVYEGRIDGEFNGWEENTVFATTDGYYFIQVGYNYNYHYAYQPVIEVLSNGSQLRLRVKNTQRSVVVKQLSSVIKTRIQGSFDGLEYGKKFRLQNGQVWQQLSMTLSVDVKINPQVLLYANDGNVYMQIGSKTIKVQRLE